jgi:hypothetical protein
MVQNFWTRALSLDTVLPRNKLTKTAGSPRFNRGSYAVQPRIKLGSISIQPRIARGYTAVQPRLCGRSEFWPQFTAEHESSTTLPSVNTVFSKSELTFFDARRNEAAYFKCIQKFGKQCNGKAIFVFPKTYRVHLITQPQLYWAISCIYMNNIIIEESN